MEDNEKKEKKDYSSECSFDDDDENCPCKNCLYFLFPIGCMYGEEE